VEFGTPAFWVAALEIIVINILLSGDNAVVIALACRNLPPKQKWWGIFWGVVGAVGLRIILTFFAVQLLALPYFSSSAPRCSCGSASSSSPRTKAARVSTKSPRATSCSRR
jgi:hypothetical protein